MGCDEVRGMLDAFVDGELSARQERALMEHAAGCEACGKEIEAAILLRDALKDMDQEVSVPLEAQAAWRRAVREEAARRRRGRWMRYACGAAAALVLAAGCTLTLRGDLFKKEQPVVLNETAPMARAIVAADGVQEASVSGAASAETEAYTVWQKYEVADVDVACEAVGALAEEYSASFSMSRDDGVVSCRIELPCDYAADFLSAVRRIGTELDSRSVQPSGDTSLICIQIGTAAE